MIPGDQPDEGIDGYGWKDFENRKVSRWVENALRKVSKRSRIRAWWWRRVGWWWRIEL